MVGGIYNKSVVRGVAHIQFLIQANAKRHFTDREHLRQMQTTRRVELSLKFHHKSKLIHTEHTTWYVLDRSQKLKKHATSEHAKCFYTQ